VVFCGLLRVVLVFLWVLLCCVLGVSLAAAALLPCAAAAAAEVAGSGTGVGLIGASSRC
jgi:hypothetical protein